MPLNQNYLREFLFQMDNVGMPTDISHGTLKTPIRTSEIGMNDRKLSCSQDV